MSDKAKLLSYLFVTTEVGEDVGQYRKFAEEIQKMSSAAVEMKCKTTLGIYDICVEMRGEDAYEMKKAAIRLRSLPYVRSTLKLDALDGFSQE